jgi:DNA-binding response OmpR family regulator
MLTARSSEMDRIIGLEIWADDYIPKPFSPRELLARINTILRRSKAEKDNPKWDNDILDYKNIKIDTKRKQVFLDDVDVCCTWNEYDILKKLFIEWGKIVSRETIMTEIIGYDNYIYDRTIDTHIKNLRKKLGDKDVILTIRWEGYRLNK